MRIFMRRVALTGVAAVLHGSPGQGQAAESPPLLLPPMRAPASPVKGSGVRVTYEVAPTDGRQGARVTLRLSGVIDPAGASVHYTLQGPGRILAQDATPLPAGGEAVRVVTVSFDPSRRVYLNVFTRQGARAGVMAVPLGPPPPGAAPMGKAQASPGSPPLVVLPAQTR